jgi:hypothetical protein
MYVSLGRRGLPAGVSGGGRSSKRAGLTHQAKLQLHDCSRRKNTTDMRARAMHRTGKSMSRKLSGAAAVWSRCGAVCCSARWRGCCIVSLRLSHLTGTAAVPRTWSLQRTISHGGEATSLRARAAAHFLTRFDRSISSKHVAGDDSKGNDLQVSVGSDAAPGGNDSSPRAESEVSSVTRH